MSQPPSNTPPLSFLNATSALPIPAISLWHPSHLTLVLDLVQLLHARLAKEIDAHGPGPELEHSVLMNLLPLLLEQFRPLTRHPHHHHTTATAAPSTRQITKTDTCGVLLDALNYALCVDSVVLARDGAFVGDSGDCLLKTSTTRQVKVLLLVSLSGLVKRLASDRIITLLIPSTTAAVPTYSPLAATNTDILLRSLLTSVRWDAPSPSSSQETRADISLAWYIRACARDILNRLALAVRPSASQHDPESHRVRDAFARFVEAWVEGLEEVRMKIKCGGMEEVTMHGAYSLKHRNWFNYG
ncbi:hypothetical protein BC938DRAFT_481973 [Jimgerdemannia flammicorona]|uniref:Uncharacterized protein n=1 Tax=Jimgerdemannia flammicorona TaxID=994334 RepID=A0A433QF29_9FUNG|nr:hypothetical protein BC938DRAFT_481973 [Jimgerdemannia flammicorona]